MNKQGTACMCIKFQGHTFVIWYSSGIMSEKQMPQRAMLYLAGESSTTNATNPESLWMDQGVKEVLPPKSADVGSYPPVRNGMIYRYNQTINK